MAADSGRKPPIASKTPEFLTNARTSVLETQKSGESEQSLIGSSKKLLSKYRMQHGISNGNTQANSKPKDYIESAEVIISGR